MHPPSTAAEKEWQDEEQSPSTAQRLEDQRYDGEHQQPLQHPIPIELIVLLLVHLCLPLKSMLRLCLTGRSINDSHQDKDLWLSFLAFSGTTCRAPTVENRFL